jgi:hypothetical protein
MDDDVSELEDTGDLWLAFWVLSVLVALGTFALLQLSELSTTLAVVVAVPGGFVVGGVACRIRVVRRWVSRTVQTLWFPWW